MRAGALLALAGAATAAWTIVWEDDFNGPNGTAPNASNWNVADNPGLSGNKELEYYAPANVYLDGKSNLVLKSVPQDYKGFNYTSGWVDTALKFNFTFGKLEVRAKLPTGQGIWPAHWAMPDYPGICWPRGGEIDILERINTVPMVHGALHWSTEGCGDPTEQNGGNWSGTLPYDPSDDFHLYSIVWDAQADTIAYAIDDDVYTTVDTVSTKFPQLPFHVILNTAVGGSWPGSPNATTVWPQYHLIDYVRWYVQE